MPKTELVFDLMVKPVWPVHSTGDGWVCHSSYPNKLLAELKAKGVWFYRDMRISGVNIVERWVVR